MPPRRLSVVVNPRGGKHRGLMVLDRVRPVLEAVGISLDVRVTERAGHAEEIVGSLDLRNCDGVCAIGGDGTVHEVVNGLMRRHEVVTPPLGMIPAGTGNTLHQHLGCEDPLEAARRIAAGATQPLDVVRVIAHDEEIYCVNIVGWGAVADINHTAERLRWLGTRRYSASALWHIMRGRHRRAKLVVDEREVNGEFLFAIACNTKFTGAGMKLAPDAEVGDGKVDLVVVRRVSRRQMLKLFTSVFDGSHRSLGYVEFHQVRSFAIESQTTDRLDLDGEMKGHTPMSAEVMPGALRVFG